jgi:meiotically up-regulated gene 157 (Mug157) protein
MGWLLRATGLRTISAYSVSSSVVKYVCDSIVAKLDIDFITSDNAMMSVELSNIADMLSTIGTQKSLVNQLRQYSNTIKQAIWAHTRTPSGIFAYETNGLDAQYIMDDANVPSLVSLPYLGFLERSDATYQKTKAAMFSRTNPYYAVGKSFNGIG